MAFETSQVKKKKILCTYNAKYLCTTANQNSINSTTITKNIFKKNEKKLRYYNNSHKNKCR